ncbi:MAG: HNH endonuclease [Pirellulaceae bacterium]|nr:HNH endonuclease [Pirellulaceae bacterium]
MVPFDYPAESHARRHGPQGYADYESYRPWLRDEFTFRCVYCLQRERWSQVSGTYHIDHFQAIAVDSQRKTDYDNLLYVCARCNLAKRDRTVPDPTIHLTANEVRVHPDGRLDGLTAAAQSLIAKLDLDSPQARQWRLIWMRNVELARAYDPEQYERLMGFPDDLPDLSRLRPPGGNIRPTGVESSYFARRRGKQLPSTY